MLADPSAGEPDVETRMRITYTIELHSEAIDLDAASAIDPIPERATFAGFGDNAAGATYDAGQNYVSWSGAIPRNSPPLTAPASAGVGATLCTRVKSSQSCTTWTTSGESINVAVSS